MSWQQPTDFEHRLVDAAGLRAPWGDLAPLARLLRLLSPATRIEPLLLRNARCHFLPGSGAEIESLLWFSPLVGARSSSDVVLHGGVARLLAGELRGDGARFAEALAFIDHHSRHWLPEDRLAQTLRLDTLRPPDAATQEELRQGLRDMLRLIGNEGDEARRMRLARSIRQTLATVGSDAAEAFDELRWLRQYASCRLGTTATPAAASPPAAALPAWLGEPPPSPRFRRARLAVRVHHDVQENRTILHFVDAGDAAQAIEFPTPLPADLHVGFPDRPDHPGRWHLIGSDRRVRVPPIDVGRALRLVLTTIDGRRHQLRATLPEPPGPLPPTRLLLSHLAEDRAPAQAIARWLRTQGVGAELIEEDAPAAGAGGHAAAADDEPEPAVPILRLWTPAARRRLARGPDALPALAVRSALLRVDPAVELPQPGFGAERVLDLAGWSAGQSSEEAGRFLRQLDEWLAGDAGPSEPPSPPVPPDPPVADTAERERAAERQRLLAELEDPGTLPPRRLAIGDRLAEIGDPRPGVGVREVEVEVDADGPPAEDAPVEDAPAPSEADALLAELLEPATTPPRRLAIGDRLAEIGDPRRGVGLDLRGLPDIDWVRIPGGDFIYQEGEKRSLPTFHLARYPVTNAQYEAFVAAGGYGQGKKTAAWWRGLKRPELSPSTWPQPNRPRTDVNWYEAVAFCRWLSAQLGYEVRLPREDEWERAARAQDGRDYPWGKSYASGQANVDEAARYGGKKTGKWSLEQTTAVGVYPHGASEEGVLDLCGNVWEWCRNRYDQPDRTELDTGDAAGVVRGGCWGDLAVDARASWRLRHDPVYRYLVVGFRVLSSAPIS
ncbi:MAG: formylglycine-generating enzyme family protein [Candidatus Accumulibacter sp.]|uniref:formylglycine-generating enzyme family protein n=1 Tax=Accumulibacter sp. TaxID=2053492 RepID=UPI002879E23C|nr:formylglycine-generating enzyme family protein [Accumulibacter sp.]MDS4014383.1 formylglycine-generating enzyme family protein [Accumulibacter sp.]